MKVPVALALILALVLREVPARAATPDVGEARRRFVAAVQSSDQAVAAAEAALESLIGKSSEVLTGMNRQHIATFQKALQALRDFKAEKSRILARDLGTYEKLMKAAQDYARACQALAAVLAVTVAVVVVVAEIVIAAGAAVLSAGVVLAVCAGAVAAIVLAITAIISSLPQILRLLGFREEGDSVERWMKDNPWFGTTLAAVSVVAAVLSSVASAVVALRQADAAARDARARLNALPRPAVALPTLPPSLTAFDGWVGSHLAVHLDSGKATAGSAEATLEGGATVSLRSDASVKISVNGRVVLRAGGGGTLVTSEIHKVAAGPSAASAQVSLGGGPSIRTWSALEGQGSVHASLWGWSASLGDSRGLAAGSDGILYVGTSSFDFFGCRYETDEQSRLEASTLTLHGRLACGSFFLNESTARIGPSGRSGSGRLQFFGHAYDATYDFSAAHLKARGRYDGPTTGWTRVPGFDADYRVSHPTVDVRLDGASVSATFDTDRIEVQTMARNKGGRPWAQASLDPDPVTVSADGNVVLRLAHLPSVSDVERGARELCITAANKLPLASARSAAVDLCTSDHPSPPSIPNLPTSITVNIGVIVK